MMTYEESTQIEKLHDRIGQCEQSLARIDERTEMMYNFGLKVWRVGLTIAGLVLGIDLVPMLGVI